MTTVTELGGATQAHPLKPGTIYVLAPVHNRRAITERFARCLAAQTDQAFHLVLVDDGSTDGTAEGVLSILPGTTVIRGKGHWWWAGSLEQARRWLIHQPSEAGQLVLIANDDTTFEPDFLAAGRVAMGNEARALVLAQAYSAETGELASIGVAVDWNRLTFKGADDPTRIDCFSTRGLFLRREAFLALGGFHTVLLPHYLSDYEFTMRAARKGYALHSDPRVRLVMDEKSTGIRERNLASPIAYLRDSLTIKATRNPIYWSTFVLLAAPPRRKAPSLLRVWWRFLRGLVKSTRTAAPAT